MRQILYFMPSTLIFVSLSISVQSIITQFRIFLVLNDSSFLSILAHCSEVFQLFFKPHCNGLQDTTKLINSTYTTSSVLSNETFFIRKCRTRCRTIFVSCRIPSGTSKGIIICTKTACL